MPLGSPHLDPQRGAGGSLTLILMGSGFSQEAEASLMWMMRCVNHPALGPDRAEPRIHLKTNKSPKPKLIVLSHLKVILEIVLKKNKAECASLPSHGPTGRARPPPEPGANGTGAGLAAGVFRLEGEAVKGRWPRGAPGQREAPGKWARVDRPGPQGLGSRRGVLNGHWVGQFPPARRTPNRRKKG